MWKEVACGKRLKMSGQGVGPHCWRAVPGSAGLRLHSSLAGVLDCVPIPLRTGSMQQHQGSGDTDEKGNCLL